MQQLAPRLNNVLANKRVPLGGADKQIGQFCHDEESRAPGVVDQCCCYVYDWDRSKCQHLCI